MNGTESPPLFVAEAVRRAEALHPYLADPAYRASPIAAQLDRQARTLVDGHARGDGRVSIQLSNWLPDCVGLDEEAILSAPLDLAQARTAVAREHGFSDWAAVEALAEARLDPPFEEAVDLLISGNAAGLARAIDGQPDLVHARSRFGHGATLLHYIGANGVETWRQKSPLNGAALARLLLERGADPLAHAHMYGGGQTALNLVVTSAHPAEAGTAVDIAHVLQDAMGVDPH